MGLHAHGVHHGVRSTAVCALPQFLGHAVVQIQGLNAVALGHGPALGDRVHGDHAVAQVAADPGRKLAHRAQTQHGQGATLWNIGVLHALPGGGHNV